jgi:hypothetical protein
MDIPKVLREQIKEYARAGFNVVKWEHRKGSHWKLWFAELAQPQIVTQNMTGWRCIKNTIASYRRQTKKNTGEI